MDEAIEPEVEKSGANQVESQETKDVQRQPARDIKGNIPYSPSPGSISAILTAMVDAERPDKFTNNFMETVLNQSGGGARSVPPLLKKMGFLTGDGTPTELYSKFKTSSGRSLAAFNGLRSAFPEVFRRNEFAHKASEEQVRDILVEITGLKKNDSVLRLMYKSFEAIRNFIGPELEAMRDDVAVESKDDLPQRDAKVNYHSPHLGLSYQINVVLPESQDPTIYDAIFKSIKRNLLT